MIFLDASALTSAALVAVDFVLASEAAPGHGPRGRGEWWSDGIASEGEKWWDLYGLIWFNMVL